MRVTISDKLKILKCRNADEVQKIKAQLAKTVLMCRNERHVSQKQLSERTGIPQADISRLESAEANPTLDKICRIANAFDMNVKLTFEPKIVVEYV